MVQTPSQPEQLPILESGDRLNRYEFERRYNAMSHLHTAELIEGVVYVPAALRFRSHAQPHGNLMGWLWTYSVATPGVALGDNPTIRLDLDNEPQPDAVLLIEEALGGQARLTSDDYIEGAPELVVAVAASSAAIDLHDKQRAYRRNGVLEYLVWQVFEPEILWFSLQAGEYVRLPRDDQGILRSQVFPGLWLAAEAMIMGEMQQVLRVLNQGIAALEHAEFVQRLAAP
jgi:Uma2 family endonuclease